MADSKRIIVLSALWSGIKPFFLNAEEEFKGMPAFTNTFLELIENPKVEKVHVFFFGGQIITKYKLPHKYEHKIEVKGYSYSSKLSALVSLVRLTSALGYTVLANRIDVIYSHGPIGGIGALISTIFGTKNIRRLYGTFMARKLTLPKYKLFFMHPLEYLTFSLPGTGLVITNDGTKGDLVYGKIGNKKMPLHFWLNGVDKQMKIEVPLEEIQKKYRFSFVPDICYFARIDLWKRQHLLLDILVALKEQGINCNAVFAGPILNNNYYVQLLEKVKKNNVEDSIVIVPGMTRKETQSVISNSKLSASLYDYSNLGNVFLESLTLGTPMLSENIEHSLDVIDSEAYFQIDPENVLESATTLKSILNTPDLIDQKSRKASFFAKTFLKTWEERAKMELELLEI